MICEKCGNDLPDESFPILKGPDFWHRKLETKYPICKFCLSFALDENNLEQVKELCKTLDIPFVEEIWYKTKHPDCVFWKYLNIMHLGSWYGLGYQDYEEYKRDINEQQG